MKSRCHCDNGAFYFFNADCRPAGDDAETGAALNPKKFKRATKARLLFLRPSPPTQASLVAGFGHKKTPSVCSGLSGVGGPKRTSVYLKSNFHF